MNLFKTLRFKLYDWKNRRMVPITNASIIIDEKGAIVSVNTNNRVYKLTSHRTAAGEGYTALVATSIQDVMKAPVYEEDILQWKMKDDVTVNLSQRGVVVYDVEKAIFCVEDVKGNVHPLNDLLCDGCSIGVLGSRVSNPSLWKSMVDAVK